MSDDKKTWMWQSLPDINAGLDLMGRLFDVTRPTAVFSEPVTTGATTIITASELNVGLGFGYGGGGGYEAMPPETDAVNAAQTAVSGDNDSPDSSGFGSGGGGGGIAGSRPIAAIIIQGDNVRVEPIVDATKIALAFLTTLGTIFALGAKMRAGGKHIP